MGSFARSLPIDPLHSFLADFCLVCGISGTLGVSEQELDFRFQTSCAEALRLWPKTWQRLGYPRAWSNGMFIHVHCRPSPGTFVIRRFENSRSIFPPIRPARPIAALVKTKFGPRFAGG